MKRTLLRPLSVHRLWIRLDGKIPSEKSCGSVEEIDEERRLFYTAPGRK